MGQHDLADRGPCCGLARLMRARVVVHCVQEALHRDLLDQRTAQDGLDIHVGTGAEPIEPFAGNRVTGQNQTAALVLDAVAHGRVHGSMVCGSGDHPHPIGLEDDSVGDLGNDDRRSPVEVLMVGQAVGNILRQHGQCGIDVAGGGDGTEDLQRVLRW